MAPMAAELNLPTGGQSDTRQEETEHSEEQNLIEEPEPEVPVDEMSSSNLVHLESKLEPVKLSNEEKETTENVSDTKTIGAEVAALLDAVNAETKIEKEIVPELVLRKKSKELEDEDIGKRGSTFLTEIEDNEDVGPEVAKIADKIVSESISDIESDDHRLTSSDVVDNRVEVIEPLFVEKIVQPLGIGDTPSNNDEVDSKKETVSESQVETIGEIISVSGSKDHITNKSEEMTEQIKEILPTKEDLSKDESSAETKKVFEDELIEDKKIKEDKTISESFSQQNVIEATTKQESLTETEVEVIGQIDDKISSDDIKENKTLIDITVIEKTEDKNKIKSETISASENEAKRELDEALKDIPEISSSISAQDLLQDSMMDEEDSSEVVAEIASNEQQQGALIDITVIEETDNKDKSVQEVVKEAKELFTAEVIPDNADIEVIGDEGESVVELTMEAKDAIPLGAIAVATFAIFLALLFYWN